jgi:2,4-dienoyl-CoA reductase-like NADH-dependent reductase (Old Yellow Enzyme family)
VPAAAAKALDEAEIGALIQRFARTAALAGEAGFSGVQIHAAHGYLLSQFLSPLSNQRQDRWGAAWKIARGCCWKWSRLCARWFHPVSPWQ